MALRASCSDLLLLLTAQVKDGKRIGFLKVGNEPDWNLRNVLNSLYVCRLYAARYLAHNNMEHIWSLMRRRLTSAILPSVREGDIDPPYKQTNISLDEIREKEAQAIFLLTCQPFNY